MSSGTGTHSTHPSLHIAEIRELARRYDADSIEQCMELALQNQPNPCYGAGDLEEVMNVLAKANFVSEQTEKGMTIAEAIRELGKRIRAVQGQ